MKATFFAVVALALLATSSTSASAMSISTASTVLNSSNSRISTVLSPVLESPPSASSPGIFEISATGDLDGSEETIEVFLNDTSVGVFGAGLANSVVEVFGLQNATLTGFVDLSADFLSDLVGTGSEPIAFRFAGSNNIGSATVTGSISAVPEPTTAALLVVGALTCVGTRRRKSVRAN